MIEAHHTYFFDAEHFQCVDTGMARNDHAGFVDKNWRVVAKPPYISRQDSDLMAIVQPWILRVLSDLADRHNLKPTLRNGTASLCWVLCSTSIQLVRHAVTSRVCCP